MPPFTPTRERGGRAPEFVPLLTDTIADVSENLQGYLMVGLAFYAAVLPVTTIGGFLGMLAMYAFMAIGSLVGILGAAIAGDSGGGGPGALFLVVASVGCSLLGVMAFVAVVLLSTALVAPVSASVYRAIAAHQRGDGTLGFAEAFATWRQDAAATVLVMVMYAVAGVMGLLCCYIGALVPAVLVGFAFSLVALHRRGAWEAMRTAAGHAFAYPMVHVAWALPLLVVMMFSAYVPVLGTAFACALAVRAHRRVFGDADEPVLTLQP